MSYNSQSEFERCKEWCTDNNLCGGFAVTPSNCYFKNLDCINTAASRISYLGTSLFLKAGKFSMHQ